MTWPRSPLLGTDQNFPGSPTDSIAALPEAAPETVSTAAISNETDLFGFIFSYTPLDKLA